MRRLIVHVGPHKTGSTSIQRALFFASKGLLDIGVYYPSEWITPENRWSHYALFKQLRGGEFDLVNNTAAQALNTNADTIILSAEDLSLLSVDELNTMSRAFRSADPDLNISIVFYVRRWSAIIPSVVQELIKHGFTLTLGDIVAQELMSPEQSDFINYVNRLERFSTVFGTESINIISFDNLVDSKQNLVDHFFENVLSCARTKSDTYDVDTQHNISLPIVEVEFLRVHNCLVKSGHVVKFAGNADQYLNRLRASDIQELAEVLKGSVRDLKIDETALPFRVLYDALAAKYHRRFLNPNGSSIEPLFRRLQRNIPYVHPNYLCDPHVVNAMISLNKNINDQAAEANT